MKAAGRWRPGEVWPVSKLSSAEWALYYQAGFRWRERDAVRILVDGPGALASAPLRRHLEQDPPAARFAWHIYDSLPSTMPVAHDLYRESRTPVAVLADEQTAGRGRGDHVWHATPAGGLNLSLAWEGLDTMLSGPLTLAMGVAVAEAIHRLTGHAIGLKWPNDGLSGGRKCFGILVEAVREHSPRIVAGIGINVNGIPPVGAGGEAASLEMLTGEPWSRLVLAVRVAAEVATMLDRWQREGPAPLLQAWRRLSVTLGEPVAVLDGNGSRNGTARDIHEDGSLRVDLADGTEISVYAGEVSLRLSHP